MTLDRIEVAQADITVLPALRAAHDALRQATDPHEGGHSDLPPA